MKYPSITALVPAGEHFDLSAMNEGIWLTASHVNAIEQALGSNATSVAAITGERDTARQQLADAQAAANTASTQSAAALTTANATIKTLQDEVALLKKGPATDFSTTPADEDKSEDGKKPVPAHASDSDPLNAFADKYFKPSKA